MSKSELDQKLQHKPQFVLKIVFFNFGRKKPENSSLKKRPLFDLFWSFFWHLHTYLSKNLSTDGHFEGLNMSES